MSKSELIVGLDIGTTKICAVVGEPSENGGMDIVGIGTSPSTGLRKGVVVNIEQTVQSIKRALEEAELMAGCEIRSVYAGIAGSHIKGFNSHGVIAVKGGEVSPRDIERALDAAKAVAIPLDREVIHILPQEYIVDDQRGIADPMGMAGVRLEVKVHIVTGAVTSAQNIVRSCHKSGLTCRTSCWNPSPRPRPCSPKRSARSAWPSSTSAAGPATSPFSPTIPSSIRACWRLAGRT